MDKLVKRNIVLFVTFLFMNFIILSCYSVQEVGKDDLAELNIKKIVTVNKDTINIEEWEEIKVNELDSTLSIISNDVVKSEIEFNQIGKVFSNEYDGGKTFTYTLLVIGGILVVFYLAVKASFDGRGFGG